MFYIYTGNHDERERGKDPARLAPQKAGIIRYFNNQKKETYEKTCLLLHDRRDDLIYYNAWQFRRGRREFSRSASG